MKRKLIITTLLIVALNTGAYARGCHSHSHSHVSRSHISTHHSIRSTSKPKIIKPSTNVKAKFRSKSNLNNSTKSMNLFKKNNQINIKNKSISNYSSSKNSFLNNNIWWYLRGRSSTSKNIQYQKSKENSISIEKIKKIIIGCIIAVAIIMGLIIVTGN